MPIRITKEIFIEKASLKHNNKYNYNKVIYQDSKQKILITCPIHGDFEQIPNSHLLGRGCFKCSNDLRSSKMLLTLEQFIEKSIEVHSNRYDYSLVDYKGKKFKVKIVCKNHGIFEQNPQNHINGQGCFKCSLIRRYLKSTTDFIAEANIKHSFKYDYSKVTYEKSYLKVLIGCKQHGFFEQEANSHLQGKGCPICSKELIGYSKTLFINLCNKNNNGLGILYVLRCWNENENFYKIGRTSSSISKRFSGTSKMPYNYEVVQEIHDNPETIFNLEYLLHNFYKDSKYRPLLFFKGYNECFKISKDNI